MSSVNDIIYTSVQDGLCSATYASPEVIKRAIAAERKGSKRTALITGLERELRRRQKARLTPHASRLAGDE